MEFKKLTWSDRQKFDDIVKNHPYQNAESSYANMYLWSKAFGIKAAYGKHALNIKFMDSDGNTHYLAPFLYDFNASIVPALGELGDYIHAAGQDFCIKGVVKDVREKIENEMDTDFKFFDDRDNYEYIYLADDLANLTGKKFHAKRNHINYFEKTYSFAYRAYDDSLKQECIAHIESWVKGKGDANNLMDEIDVLHRMLDDHEKLGVNGAVVLVDGKVEALTFGEALNDETALIHIEKANPEIRGLYPFINREFVKNAWADFKYINREEDMGLAGLRKAKLSYNPVYLLEKYSCSVDGDCDGM